MRINSKHFRGSLFHNIRGKMVRGCIDFVFFFFKGPCLVLLASLYIMSSAGSTLTFSSYSDRMKKKLSYTQTTLNFISSIKDLGENLEIFSVLLERVAPAWVMLVFGALFNFSGYLFTWLAVSGRIAEPALWQIVIGIFLAANAQNFSKKATLSKCVKTFPESQSIMLGLFNGYLGLSSAIITQFFWAAKGIELLLFLSLMPSLMYMVFAYIITQNAVKMKQENEGRLLDQFLKISAALGLFLMVGSISQPIRGMSKLYTVCAVMTFLIMCTPSVVAVREELINWRKMKDGGEEIVEEAEQSPSNIEAEQIQSLPKSKEFSLKMLMILLLVGIGVGSSLSAIDNLGQVGESLQYKTGRVQTFVSLVSIWNYCGRVFSIKLSDCLLKKYKLPRPFVLSTAVILSCLSCTLIVFPVRFSIYGAAVLAGFSYGSQIALIDQIIPELFEVKYYFRYVNCGDVASVVGSFFIKTQITGRIYDNEASHLDESETRALVCVGRRCFQSSFGILSLANFFVAVSWSVLAVRAKEIYQAQAEKENKEEGK